MIVTALEKAVSKFGAACAEKLAGPGDREAAIRSPLDALIREVGAAAGVHAVLHDEVRDVERRVRPDYGVSVRRTVMGYIEVKAPGRTIDPARFTGHDKQQWERQRDLPNLLYTNGTDWALYRDGAPFAEPVRLTDEPLAVVGADLAASPALETLLTAFLTWKPAPVTSVSALVRAVAPLTRLLRGEVLDQLAAEQRAVAAGARREEQPFHGLASDWRALLFPTADDRTFADGYAQAVTFALLLARTEGIDVAVGSLHAVGDQLRTEHSLMGRALQVLTENVAADFKVTLDLLVSVIGAVDWARIRRGGRDVYLHLYEHFLDQYDPELRRKSGTYYTPRDLVEHMVRLTEEVLTGRLGLAAGFASDQVVTVDPAMGTGTYLHTILDRVAEDTRRRDGDGAVAAVLRQVASRLVGFELQMGPYAVAELRTSDLLAAENASTPPGGLHLYVTDTLDDPHAAETQIASGLRLIAASRRAANEVKARQNVTVVIGNPPYHELVAGMGGWVEHGSGAHGTRARGILQDFLEDVPGKLSAKLKNLYVYFYRWATWKVWESTAQQSDTGVVCFVTTAGYLTGPAFTSMRRYLRRSASEGWIIDLTPEGQTPDVPTRIFPGVRQPLAIGIFVRRPDTDPSTPARLRYRSLAGTRRDKFDALSQVQLDDAGWHEVRTGWTDPFTPAPTSAWDTWPAVSDLMPWKSPGLYPTRQWVYSPSPTILVERWRALVAETDPAAKSAKMNEKRDSNLDKRFPPLAGTDVVTSGTNRPLREETRLATRTVPIGFRAFDRQHVIADRRLFTGDRPDLWRARIPGQIFVVEQHTQSLKPGPGLVFSGLLPDYHHFDNRGGRTLPFLHPDGTPNLAPGLTGALTALLGRDVDDHQVLAYVAAITGHPGFASTFAAELETPGVRVPLTADPDLWKQAVDVGTKVLWLHTFGLVCSGPGRPAGDVRLPLTDPRRPFARTGPTQMPAGMIYDGHARELVIGDARVGPVDPGVVAYTVGGRQVLKGWFDYRKAQPAGKRGSPLDHIVPDRWEPAWTSDLLDLISVLTQLVDLEPRQAALLSEVANSPLVDAAALNAAGVRWPATDADRRARSAAQLSLLADET